MYNCNCKLSCPLVAILASIIVGIVAAFLRITATITLTPVFLFVILGVSVVYLAITLITAALTNDTDKFCICPTLSVLLTGILGAILTGLILLGITFAATSIVGAIITGLLFAFVSLFLTSTACLAKCLVDCDN